VTNKKKRHQREETLTGIVTPVEWENYQVVEVALSATDDELYMIENGDKFIDLVQTCIQATGLVKRDRKSARSIKIKKFNVIEEF
jgi:hypothetical protein